MTEAVHKLALLRFIDKLLDQHHRINWHKFQPMKCPVVARNFKGKILPKRRKS